MDKSPLTAQDFYEIDFVSDPQISPDGRWIAVVRLSIDREENQYRSAIWLAATDGGPPKQFTAGTHRDTSPHWSPDGRQLAFVSNRSGEKSQIYVMPIDGGEALQLTKMPNGAQSPAWSPDGTRLAFLSSVDADERAAEEDEQTPPSDPDERELWDKKRELEKARKTDPMFITRFPYRVGTDYLGNRYPHIYVIDLQDKKAQRITDGDRVYDEPVWTSDGTAILASVNRDPQSMDISFPSEIVRIPVEGGEAETLTPPTGNHATPRPSPDGKWIAYLTSAEEHYAAQNRDIAILPADGGPPQVLTTALDAFVSDYRWSTDSASLYLTYGSWGNVGVHCVSLQGDARQVVQGDRTVLGFDVSADHLAYTVTAPHIPADLYLAGSDGSDEQRLTEINAAFLSKRWLSTPQEIRYTRPDGTRIQGWVMHPPDFEPGTPAPLAVEIHGGPHAMWGNTFWHEFQVIAGQGYAVFFCNPRGSDGYGFAFRDAIHTRWGEEDAGDILAGVDGLIKQGIADPERLTITGGSYGGFMTAWIIGHDQRFKAAVSQRGVYTLPSFYGVTDIPVFIEREFDVAPWQDIEQLWQHSPLAYVDKMHTPLLILHSERDFRVPISDGEQLYTVLKRLKREVAMLRYPREGHELSRSGEPEHRVDRITRIVDWFNQHIER